MALITCPDCNREISDKATACPNCGHPTETQAHRFAGPPGCCSLCGGSLKKGTDAKSEGSGCLILLFGLLLSPFLLGIPIALYGLHLMSKREGFWRCRKCDAKFDREIKWYEFG